MNTTFHTFMTKTRMLSTNATCKQGEDTDGGEILLKVDLCTIKPTRRSAMKRVLSDKFTTGRLLLNWTTQFSL